MKFKTIKKKLIATFILIILVPMCTTGIISNVILYNSLKDSYISSMEKSVEGVNNVIDETYNGYEVAFSSANRKLHSKGCLIKSKWSFSKKRA